MTSAERVARSLLREPVDRVPTYEWTIDEKVIHQIIPGCSYETFVVEANLDAICTSLDFETIAIDEECYKDEWGITHGRTKEDHSYPIKGCIAGMKDLDRYAPPGPKEPKRYQKLEDVMRRNAGQKAVILHLNDVVSIPRNLMGYEAFLVATMENPALIEGLVELSVDLNIEFAREARRRGVRIVYTGDDYAFNGGLLFPVGTFKKLFYPGLKRVIGAFKEMGFLVVKHTDGNIMSIIEEVIETGIDCLDPIDPQAGMDLAYIKEKYGSRIALKGNVDCARTLTFGRVEEVIRETRHCLDIAGTGTGYILSSSNSIHSAVRPENYLAMLWTLRTFAGGVAG
jgi:uroporphyrinogen decarboxylase